MLEKVDALLNKLANKNPELYHKAYRIFYAQEDEEKDYTKVDQADKVELKRDLSAKIDPAELKQVFIAISRDSKLQMEMIKIIKRSPDMLSRIIAFSPELTHLFNRTID